MTPLLTTAPRVALSEIEARTVCIPVERAVVVPSGTIAERWYTVVRVRAVDGTTGWGWCYTGAQPTTIATRAVVELFAPVLRGSDGSDPATAWDAMYAKARFAGRSGLVMRALSAVDVALWDRAARSVGVPMWEHLGGSRRTMRAYASSGYDDGSSVDELASHMRSLVEGGFTAVKIRVGGRPLGADTERIAAVRAAIGPDAMLMLDAACAWSTISAAANALDAWRPFAPYWIEEPFPPDDVDLLTQLSRTTDVTIAVGENESGRWRFQELARTGAVGVLQPDAAVCGGVTEFRRIVEIAEQHGIDVAPHWFPELHVQLASAFEQVTWVEWMPAASPLNIGVLFECEARPQAGDVVAPAEPGHGIELDLAALERFAVGGWT